MARTTADFKLAAMGLNNSTADIESESGGGTPARGFLALITFGLAWSLAGRTTQGGKGTEARKERVPLLLTDAGSMVRDRDPDTMRLQASPIGDHFSAQLHGISGRCIAEGVAEQIREDADQQLIISIDSRQWIGHLDPQGRIGGADQGFQALLNILEQLGQQDRLTRQPKSSPVVASARARAPASGCPRSCAAPRALPPTFPVRTPR